MLVNVQNVTKSFLDDVVLENVSLDINEGDRTGLMGINGAGKTTLLNIIAGRLQPDDGQVVRARGLQMGYLRQNDALTGTRSLQAEIEDAFGEVRRVQAEMERIAALLASAPGDDALLADYDRLVARMQALDGYRMDEKISRVLNGLGFAAFSRDTLVSTLSGGEKMRFAFAKMLLQNPDLLMLDEPTNHLDFAMLAWLEEYLRGYKGAVLVVSHDRYFLDAVAQNICELEHRRLWFYKGGYTRFLCQKEERLKVAWRAYEKQQEEIEKLTDYVRRNLVRASTTKMAQSRRRQLEKMEVLEKPAGREKTIRLTFDYDVEPFQNVMQCENLGVRVGEGAYARQLFEHLDLEMLRGERLALVGANGVGKSTFLKAVQDKVPHTGAARWGGNTRPAYFDQELDGLPLDETVLEAVHRCYPVKTEFEVRSALGRMLLEGESVYKKVRELSGAQRAKVALTILQMRRANVLILDEPTNHLDYTAKEELERALRQFPGTLLVVSHDRYFLRKVPTAILEMTSEGFVRYNGNYDTYLEAKQGLGPKQPPGADTQPPEETPPEKKDHNTYRTRQQRAEDAQKRQRISQLEKLMASLETEMDAAGAALADPANASDYELLGRMGEALRQCEIALDAAMEEWMALT